MALHPFTFYRLVLCTAAVAAILVAQNADPAAAAPWSYRWRSLNESASSGQCTSSMQTADLATHFREALVDIAIYQASATADTDERELCNSMRGVFDSVSRNLDASSICLNPHGTAELLAIQQYLQLLQRSGTVQLPAVVAATLAVGNYQDPAGAQLRGFFDGMLYPAVTSGPAESELSNATYQYIVSRQWNYVGLVWEAEVGSVRLSQLLRSLSRSDGRVCFPVLLSFQTGNVTDAAKTLKDFVYTARSLSRFTVVFIGSGSAFLRLWDLVSGEDSAYSDSEKRYQLALMGDAFSSYHRISDTTRRKNFALGTILIFPGILDPKPNTDELQRLVNNVTSDPMSMGPFNELIDTHNRLRQFKDQTNGACNWADANSVCYQLAQRYDFLALSLATLLADGVPTLSSLADVQRLREKTVALAALKSKFAVLESFAREGYLQYSMNKGLRHSVQGHWQPIVKIYQSQLNGTDRYALVKLGELRVRQAGTASQTYEFDVSTNSARFYQLKGGNPDISPTEATSSSECPTNCPECTSSSGKQFVQFKEGDIYLGALAPINYRGNDVFNCRDGTFRKKTVGGYELGKAFKFVVELVDTLSRDPAATLPSDFYASKVDQQFLTGVQDLLQRVHNRRTKRLRWGYVLLDTCYSPSCTMRRLSSLLDGTMGIVPGLNFTRFVGFIGSLSSTETMTASQLLKMYNLPLITYGSTSTALSDINQFPNVLRTVSSDTVIIEGMVSTLKHLKVDYITVLYAPTAYGVSLKDAMSSIATKEGICIAKQILYDCGSSDESCKRNAMFHVKTTKARYVPFLGSLQDLISLLDYSQIEADIDYISLLTTESVGVSDAAFVDKKNVGLGTLSLQLVPSPSPAFSAYINCTLTRLPLNYNNISEWDRLFFEDAQQCHLAGSYARNPAFTQPCLQALIEAHSITELESRSPFVIDAVSTLVLGTLTAMTYLCQVTTPEPACPSFFTGDFNGLLQRANLVMYGSVSASDPRPQSFSGSFKGAAWAYRKVLDNRMGRTPFSIWQYRKQGTADYRFVQIGLFDGVNSSTFVDSTATLASAERRPVSTVGSGESTARLSFCRTRADCGIVDATQCVNPAQQQQPPLGDKGQDAQWRLAFLALLFIPGVLLGFLPVLCVNLYFKSCGGDGGRGGGGGGDDDLHNHWTLGQFERNSQENAISRVAPSGDYENLSMIEIEVAAAAAAAARQQLPLPQPQPQPKGRRNKYSAQVPSAPVPPVIQESPTQFNQ